VAGVCLARNRVKALYNTVTEVGPGDASPVGTEWARSTCETVTEDDFTTFVDLIKGLGSGGGEVTGGQVNENLPGEPLCLRLTDESLLYDVVFSEWGNQEDSNFAYERTPFVSDECGVAGATCPDCICPETFVKASDGRCVAPDPCEPSPCGAGALCRRTGAREHRCECDTVEFENPPGQTAACDRVNDDICIARALQGSLFNSDQEDASAPSGVCDSAESRPSTPIFTEWTFNRDSASCDSFADEDFVNFFDEAYACGGKVPPTIIGAESCLRTTNPANDGDLWSIQFTDWCANPRAGPRGCFSLVRWREVADGEACP
jgi:hypothetical protein